MRFFGFPKREKGRTTIQMDHASQVSGLRIKGAPNNPQKAGVFEILTSANVPVVSVIPSTGVGVNATTIIGNGGFDSSVAANLQVVSSGGQTGIELWTAQTGSAGSQFFFKKCRGTTTAPTTVASGDSVFLISCSGYDGTGFDLTAQMKGIVNGAVSTGVMPIDWVWTVTGSVEALRITSAGLLGLNNAAPTYQLDTTGAIRIGSDASTNCYGLHITEDQGLGDGTQGVVTLSGGTATVSTSKASATCRIFLTINGGSLLHIGTPYVSAISAGTSFTITSTNVLDASNVAWLLTESV